MPQETNALPLGYQLEEYRIESILGTGGFGITYKARDTRLEAWVAIKEYFPIEWSFRGRDGISVQANTQGRELIPEVKASGYEWGLDRFLYEARVLASVQHAFVVRVRRYFPATGTAYIVMDYEDGEPLSALLRREDTLPEADLRGLLQEVLPALEAVHRQGYLHRDLKPSNLYIRARDGCVMLIDFGAARQSLGQHSKSITGLVTPGYSPPEQYVTRSDRYGPWTDIYALGAVLYRCITGKPPIEAPDRQMWDSMTPAVEAGSGRYGMDLLMVVDRALAMRPEDRFQTIAAVQAALAKPSPMDPPSRFTLVPKTPSPQPATRPSQLHAEPLADLFDLSTSPVSQPSHSVSRTLEPLEPSLPSGERGESYEVIEPLSLPSLSIFDRSIPPRSMLEPPPPIVGSMPAASQPPLYREPDSAVHPASAPLLKHSRRPFLPRSERVKPPPPPVLEAPESPVEISAKPQAKPPRSLLGVSLVLLGVAMFMLYWVYQDKVAILRQSQFEQEAENRRRIAEEQAQDEGRRSQAARLIEQASEALALKDLAKAGEQVERAEALQPGNSKVAAVRAQLRAEQRKIGSLEIQVEPLTAMKLVRIQQGCFQMGSPENQPERYFNEAPHQLCVNDFWLGQYEITNAQFRQFKANHDSGSFRGLSLNGDQQPAVNLSWQDASAYAEWLSERTGKHYRLPTEAEWEYAARAGTTTSRYWGENPADACRFANVADLTARLVWGAENIHNCDDGQPVTTVVGSFLPNVFKLYDMLGNVSEWTCSDYEERQDEVGGNRCSKQGRDRGLRTVRGGTWDDAPKLVRSADRNGRESGTRDNDLGFRLARQE